MAKRMKTCFGNNCFSSTLEADVKFFNFPKDLVRAQLWAEKVGRPCTIEHARRLFTRFLCHRHFSETDFSTPAKLRLNRVAVPCGSYFSSHSTPTPSGPSLHIPSLSSFPSVLNSEGNLYVTKPTRTYSKMSMSSFTEEPNSINTDNPTSSQIPDIQTTPTRTCSKMSMSSSFTEEPISIITDSPTSSQIPDIQTTPTRTCSMTSMSSFTKEPISITANSPSTSSHIPAIQTTPIGANNYDIKENSFLRHSVNASGGGLGRINRVSPTPNPRARHSLLKELNFAKVSVKYKYFDLSVAYGLSIAASCLLAFAYYQIT